MWILICSVILQGGVIALLVQRVVSMGSFTERNEKAAQLRVDADLLTRQSNARTVDEIREREAHVAVMLQEAKDLVEEARLLRSA